MEEDIFYEEKNEEGIWFRFSRGIAAVVLIIGMLYLSGGYQYLLYQKTPESINQTPLESRISGDIIEVPIAIVVLESEGEDGSQRSDDNINNLIENASRIWAQANINIEILNIERRIVKDEDIRQFIRSPFSFLPYDSNSNKNTINLFLVKRLGGINGISFGSSGVISVADITTVYDFRVLAHEVGHALGLNHVSPRNNLMHQGTNGINISQEEIVHARVMAKKLFP